MKTTIEMKSGSNAFGSVCVDNIQELPHPSGEDTMKNKQDKITKNDCLCCGKQSYKYNYCKDCLIHFYEQDFDELVKENILLKERIMDFEFSRTYIR